MDFGEFAGNPVGIIGDVCEPAHPKELEVLFVAWFMKGVNGTTVEVLQDIKIAQERLLDRRGPSDTHGAVNEREVRSRLLEVHGVLMPANDWDFELVV
ncbi:hypothetical protein EUV02_03945 [Polymorphobacter arshaanensis]|uniref:Uncharacterized protein n=1 Tax=Glacieibacterium arshaanense TaxID=2511025 RepID=A0A4Y9ESL9_9SPHN|nr:hypothetical protein [Polymorphobacter arshaanensis]TFU06173.1 hypothetical protein EUV02_03945 [Polymorphobacter arshaanensis]